MKKFDTNFSKPSPQQLNSLLKYYQAGRYIDVEKLSISITQEFPEHPFAWKVLAVVLNQNGKLRESLVASQKSVQLEPQDSAAHNNLGNTLQELGRLNEAEVSYREAITLKPDYAEAYSNLGNILKELGRLEESEASYRKAITLKPDFADAYLNLCELLENSNKLAETLLVIKIAKVKVVEKEADFLFYEALILFREENYEIAERLIKRINKDEIQEKRKINFLKLKANIYHYRKDYKLAFETFNDMNESVKDSHEYKKQEPEMYFNQQKKSIFQIEQLQRKSSYKIETQATWLQPTFLIGFPRSGTTLLDTILSSHSKINVAGEKQMLQKMESELGHFPKISMIEEIDNELAETLSGLYFKELKKHCSLEENNVAIDKLPLNILKVPLINKIFPKAKFILALRHPFDCVMSCWMQNFKMNAPMANMVDLDRVVDFYCTAMKILNLCEKRYVLNIHRVRYEDLVLNFEGEVSNILQFLNLKWEEKLRNYQATALEKGIIDTPSYSQVVKPIYKTSSYRWKNYEKYLEPYKVQLAPWLQEYGYLN